MRTVKGILIDPFALTITEVKHDADHYKGIYDLLSHESMKVSTFEIIHLDDKGDAIFIDEEASFKACERFFLLKGYHSPIAGKGLVLGSDGNGATISAKTSISKLRTSIKFAEHVPGAGLIRTGSPWAARVKMN